MAVSVERGASGALQMSLFGAGEAQSPAGARPLARAGGQSGSQSGGQSRGPSAAMAPEARPTPAQVACLKRLTRIRSDARLARFVARAVGKNPDVPVLTRGDFSSVIDRELRDRRLTH